MWVLRDLSLKGQLKAFVLLTATAVTLVYSAVLVAVDLSEHRDQAAQALSGIADRLAADLGACLREDQPDVLEKFVHALAGQEPVAAACIVDGNGEVLAQLGNFTPSTLEVPTEDREVWNHPTEDRVILLREIGFSEGTRGTLYLESNLLEYTALLVRDGWIVAALLIITLLMSWWGSGQLQKLVAQPILELVNTMRLVSQKRGYSARARRLGRGELVTLIDGFNGMLEQIERRDQIVVAARDKAEAATRAKSDFLATMSHEIRTPLNAIVGITRLFSETDLNEAQQQDIRTILDSAEHLLGLLNDLLDFSKIEAGKLELEERDVDLRRTIELVAELFCQRAEAKGLELVTDVASDFPSRLRTDEARIRQVLNNLLGNAVKFTDSGQVLMRARVLQEQTDGVQVRVEVSDTGVGISPPQKDRLFKPFEQADSSTTRRYGGTGLGLAISKKIVSLMGGEINVRSIEGRGSTFWFDIRLRRPGDQAIDTSEAPAFLDHRHVLVIEENDAVREVFVDLLGGWGARVDAVADTEAGLDLLRKSMLTDVHEIVILGAGPATPDPDPVLEEIDHHFKLNSTAIFVCAAASRVAEWEDRVHSRITGFLARPVRRDTFLQSLAAALAPREQVEAEAKPAPVRASPRGLPHILLAEDNVVNQMVALRMLKKLGYRVTVVVNGAQALARVKEANFDLILMDCRMPEMDGYEATAEIRRFHGTSRHVPIIAMTANAMPGDRERCLAAGMDDHIAKPVRPSDLGDMIKKWIGGRPAVEAKGETTSP